MMPFVDTLDQQHLLQLHQAGCQVSTIGYTEAGRPMVGATTGKTRLPLVSIVAGAHPDEPAGPVAAYELLKRWQALPESQAVRLAVIPQMDIDGVVLQKDWLAPWTGAMDLQRFLQHRLRRLPGADREFAWPGAAWGGTVLPECQAAADFLDQHGPAIAHLTLHGMSMAEGVWYLLDRPALADRQLWQDLRKIAEPFGLHESFRYGDKGFRRVGTGFSTTPSGSAMRRFFLQQGDQQTAMGFGLGSMDSARERAKRHGAPPPLTGISEFPLLKVPRGFDAQTAFHQAMTASDPKAAITNLLSQPGIEAVNFSSQVEGMISMTRAIIRAALRQSSRN